MCWVILCDKILVIWPEKIIHDWFQGPQSSGGLYLCWNSRGQGREMKPAASWFHCIWNGLQECKATVVELVALAHTFLGLKDVPTMCCLSHANGPDKADQRVLHIAGFLGRELIWWGRVELFWKLDPAPFINRRHSDEHVVKRPQFPFPAMEHGVQVSPFLHWKTGSWSIQRTAANQPNRMKSHFLYL